jgi:hypothetical protein
MKVTTKRIIKNKYVSYYLKEEFESTYHEEMIKFKMIGMPVILH